MCFISKHLSVTKAAFYIHESALECCENTENSLEYFVKHIVKTPCLATRHTCTSDTHPTSLTLPLATLSRSDFPKVTLIVLLHYVATLVYRPPSVLDRL